MARYEARAAEFAAVSSRRGLPPSHVEEAWSSELTTRQLEVLQHVADGLNNREIATRLCLGEETVKSHLRTVLVKLRADSRAHAVAIGFRESLLS
jgi:DNA-binding NarL/FixJ family response regulator